MLFMVVHFVVGWNQAARFPSELHAVAILPGIALVLT
mgnify:CR=1 FL=1